MNPLTTSSFISVAVAVRERSNVVGIREMAWVVRIAELPVQIPATSTA